MCKFKHFNSSKVSELLELPLRLQFGRASWLLSTYAFDLSAVGASTRQQSPRTDFWPPGADEALHDTTSSRAHEPAPLALGAGATTISLTPWQVSKANGVNKLQWCSFIMAGEIPSFIASQTPLTSEAHAGNYKTVALTFQMKSSIRHF